MVTLSHRHTHLWKWGSWPPSLKCPVRDWVWRWMAVGVCDTGRGGGDEGSAGQEFVAEPVLFHTAAG